MKFNNLYESLRGGLANRKTLGDLARKHKVNIVDLQKELMLGIKVEQEHTEDIHAAREIAMDHLAENPEYYTRLKEIEK